MVYQGLPGFTYNTLRCLFIEITIGSRIVAIE